MASKEISLLLSLLFVFFLSENLEHSVITWLSGLSTLMKRSTASSKSLVSPPAKVSPFNLRIASRHKDQSSNADYHSYTISLLC